MNAPADPTPSLPALPAVTLEAVELVRVRVPLVRAFTTSFGRQTERDVLLIRVEAAGATGWGEVVTTAAPRYNEEFTDGAALVLRDHLVPQLVADGRTLGAAEVPGRLAGIVGHRMARAALEVAVLDAGLRAAGRRLADHLGAVVDRVPAGVSVGIPDGGIGELCTQVAGYLDEGYLRIKAKIEPGFDLAPMRALRELVGPDVDLQVDANAAYDPDDARHLAALDALDELGLTMLEQPFAANRIGDHARHAARWRTPICLDESIHDVHDAVDAVERGAAHIINIKLGRVGGLVESLRIRDACRARGVPVWCGGMLETGVGRAANVALAACDGFVLPGDTSASDRYFATDLTDPFVLEDGHLAVPSGPGIGRVPAGERLVGAERTSLLHP
ncbi:MAG: o-succinylbenzoate synthase [Nitriliruptoraceae bacterium]|nr:o-succinylbenzoate synthase [Nitriliruptoraceae bacterium]